MNQINSKKILEGTFWSSLQSIINGSFTFLINIVLARILYPEQFGLVGMAMVFISFIQAFNELGIGASLVQKKEDELNEVHYHTAFWTGLIWSFFVYFLILIFIGPFASNFYQEPILKKIIPILSIGILISPINLVHNIQLTKKLDFKTLAFISNVANIGAGLLALTAAYFGLGVWALVINTVAISVISMPIFFKMTKWTPKFIWDKSAFRDIFGFGVYYTGTNLVNNTVSKIDYLLIGKLLSASSLGIYTLAFILTDTLRSQIMAIMNKVMYPVYGQLQNEHEKIKEYYLNVVKYNSIIIYPVMGFLIIFGEEFIINFFGEKWEEAILPLQILSLSVIFHMMVNSNTALIRGLGRPGLELKIQLSKAIFLYLPSIFIGTYYFNLIGASIAILINKLISVFIAQYFLKKLLAITFQNLIYALIPSIVSLMSSFAIVLLVNHFIKKNIFLGTFVLFSSYIIFLFPFIKKEIGPLILKLKSSKIT